jgi:hypothetical protein
MNRKVAKKLHDVYPDSYPCIITYFVLCYFLRDLLMYVLYNVLPDLKWPKSFYNE